MIDLQQSPREVTKDVALLRTDYFASIGMWPGSDRIDVRGWLRNFQNAEELRFALCLLNEFVYISNRLVVPFLSATFNSLFGGGSDGSGLDAGRSWHALKASLIVTHPQARTPSPAESGGHFARLAKLELNVPSEQIYLPEGALRARAVANDRPVLFLDDIVATGSQFISAWSTRYEVWAGGRLEQFSDYAGEDYAPMFYCPLIATQTGAKEVRSNCPGLELRPTHEIDDRESFAHPESTLWPKGLQPEGMSFIKSVSRRAGIPDSDVMGFGGMGLAVAFEHGVPDSTLPLFHHESAEWFPLVRRRK